MSGQRGSRSELCGRQQGAHQGDKWRRAAVARRWGSPRPGPYVGRRPARASTLGTSLLLLQPASPLPAACTGQALAPRPPCGPCSPAPITGTLRDRHQALHMSLARERVGMGLMVAGTAVLLARHAVAALIDRRSAAQRRRREVAERHLVLPAASTVGRRVIVVGDIHGCPGGCWLLGRARREGEGAAAERDAATLPPTCRQPASLHAALLPSLLCPAPRNDAQTS